MIFYVIKNFKHLKQKGYKPILFLILFLIISVVIQKINPSALLVNATFAFITTLMYHTIENPDVKMLGLFNKNRLLVDKNNESKINLLFKLTQEVKYPISEIYRISSNSNNYKSYEESKECIDNISYYSRDLLLIINNVLNISSLTANRIKVYEQKYNLDNLIQEINIIYKNKINNDIDFRVIKSSYVPKELYGDNFRIKQVITSLLNHSINTTREGFIELSIDSLEKNDICRLIINISDSGSGMEIDEINNVLDIDNNDDSNNYDSLNLDLVSTHKVVKLLGGSMLIKTANMSGTSITVVFDERIVKNNYDESNKINKYLNILSKNLRILVVSDKSNDIDLLLKYFNKYNVEVFTANSGEECISKIKSNEKYDVIFIEDNMMSMKGLNTFEHLKNINGFKIPTVIMIEKNTLLVKDNLIKDYGFLATLNKNNMVKELDEIVKKI